MAKKSTTEEFIKKAKKVHGDKYDYSKVNYINSKEKVDILCKTHGVFSQSPAHHLNGQNCPSCRIENIKKTSLNKYGVEWPTQSEKVKEKIEKTCLDKYGYKCSLQSPEVSKKSKESLLSKYGVDNSFKSPEVREKVKATMKDRYGAEYSFQSKILTKKIKKTCLEKYGVDNILKSPEFKDKIKNIMLEKYGVDSYMSSADFKEKSNKTLIEKYNTTTVINSPIIQEKMLEKYGSKYSITSDEIRDKIRTTNLEKFGAEYYFSAPGVQENIKKINMEKYGTPFPSKSDKIKEKQKNTFLEKYGVEYPLQVNEIKNKAIDTKQKNGTFNVSKPEEFFRERLSQLYPDLKRNYNEDSRYQFSCDFYIPERDLFIELNLFWTHQPNHGWYNPKSPRHRKIKETMESRFSSWSPMAWWTSDVLKRKTAKKNNLNYVVLWNEQDIEDWFALGCPDGHDGDGMYTWKQTKEVNHE